MQFGPGPFIQDLHGNRQGARVRRIEVRDLPQSSGGDRKGTDGVAGVTLRFLDAQKMVDGDAIEPGSEFCLTAKTGQGADGFEEDLLGSVFGVGVGMEHAKGEDEEPWKVAGEE